MIRLRPYQEESVKAGIEYVRSGERTPGLIIAPVAAGKSLIISEIARLIGDKTLVLQGSKELLEQNYGKLLALGGQATIYSASCKRKEISNMIYATLGSIKKVVGELREMGISHVIMDEAHAGYSPEPGGEFIKFMDELKPKKVIGFTATPCRLKPMGTINRSYSQLNFLTRMNPGYFKKVLHVTQVQEMIGLGYWTPLKYETWDFDNHGLILNSNASEYTQDSVVRAVAGNNVNNSILLRLMALRGQRKSILVFMDSVESCEIASAWYNRKYGELASSVVSGKTPNKRRGEIVEKFKDGTIQVVFNHSALGVGFDHPGLDCVIFGRPTFSFPVWYQVLGRAVRVKDGKDEALIVDCCNNISRFGDIRDLTIENYQGMWWMFSNDRVLTNTPLDTERTRQDLDDERHAKDRKRKISGSVEVSPITGRPDHPLGTRTMRFGKYEGWRFHSIPSGYFSFMLKHMDNDNPNNKEFLEYANFLKEMI